MGCVVVEPFVWKTCVSLVPYSFLAHFVPAEIFHEPASFYYFKELVVVSNTTLC